MKKESITYLLREIVKKVHANAGKKLEEYDLSFSQYQALVLLHYDEALSMSEVKKKLLISQSAATVVIDKLVKKKLIKREYSAKDRRKVMISRTEKGAKALERLFVGQEEYIRKMTKEIGKEDFETVKKALKILYNYMDTHE